MQEAKLAAMPFQRRDREWLQILFRDSCSCSSLTIMFLNPFTCIDHALLVKNLKLYNNITYILQYNKNISSSN